MSNHPALVISILKLYEDCHLGKHSHFAAADRKTRYHLAMGIPTMLINVLLASALFGLFKNNLPEYATVLGGALAFLAATLSGMQTLFDFKEASQGHRAVANKYLGLARLCEMVVAGYEDGEVALAELNRRLAELNAQYTEVNKQAESLPVKSHDFQKALKLREKKKKHSALLRQGIPEASATPVRQ